MLKPPNDPEQTPGDSDRPVGELVHELIEDTRNFVRNSPGLAVAGAAIIGFALVRLVKSGLDQGRKDDDE